ncbi:zinc finger protein 37 homolog isoform X2 [Maniola jurtina]|uniref:zinc finger protein 37 homolog isoform X2 n=1 Tax=Maniola jurtina TaxID=191418 RepID=UPI001E689AB4|nr:zinc finger protein 37 homolog isoform X2 [Maniola jurtina]
MDFVKREESNILDEENYKIYMENLQKSHQIDTTDYQHTISMEQLHQAVVQSSLNSSTIVHNFQLPISPRQMSTLMLKTNHLTRSLNFNELPTHLPKNLAMDMEILGLPNDLSQNLRHEDLLTQNLSRNVDNIMLARTLNNDLELQNSLAHIQNLQEQELSRNLSTEMTHNLNRINNLSHNINREISHDLGNEIDLTHLSRQNLEQDIIMNQEESRRSPLGQNVDSNLLEQHISQRLEQHMALKLDQAVERIDQNQRFDQTLAQRLDQSLAQRLDPLPSRLDSRLLNGNVLHDQRVLEQAEHLFPLPMHIKSEQEDDGYFYDNINQGMSSSNTGMNGEIPPHSDHSTPQPNTNIHQDSLYTHTVYNNHNISVPALNPIDLYSRPQNYVQNYVTENPQNLVVHRQYDNSSPYTEDLKKLRQDSVKKDAKTAQPKENLKPTDQNKMYYEYANDYVIVGKNENDSNSKLNEELAMSIKGEYICYKCNEVFPSKRVLKQHAKLCDNADGTDAEKQGKFSCSQCAYRCQSPAILKIHERTHTGEKPYACTFCEYKSGQKNNVAKHILVHMKAKPFGCQYCDYRCAQKNNLVVHERTHTGDKPFACPYCDYRTVQKPNLVKHMYLHTDQKPFSCDLCNYRCVQKANLTKHKQRHMNEKDGDKIDIKTQVKPYKPRQKSVKCPLCPYRCVQKSSLEKHMQYKHVDAECQDNLDCGLNLMKSVCDTKTVITDHHSEVAHDHHSEATHDHHSDDHGLNLMKNGHLTNNEHVSVFRKCVKDSI